MDAVSGASFGGIPHCPILVATNCCWWSRLPVDYWRVNRAAVELRSLWKTNYVLVWLYIMSEYYVCTRCRHDRFTLLEAKQRRFNNFRTFSTTETEHSATVHVSKGTCIKERMIWYTVWFGHATGTYFTCCLLPHILKIKELDVRFLAAVDKDRMMELRVLMPATFSFSPTRQR